MRPPLTVVAGSAYTSGTMEAITSRVPSLGLILSISLLALPGLPGASAT